MLLKRYKNRKLYNVSTKEYVNYDSVIRAIESGHTIRVQNTCGVDITDDVLRNIIFQMFNRVHFFRKDLVDIILGKKEIRYTKSPSDMLKHTCAECKKDFVAIRYYKTDLCPRCVYGDQARRAKKRLNLSEPYPIERSKRSDGNHLAVASS